MFAEINCSRLSSIAVSLVSGLVCLMGADSSYALNGNTWVMLCSCASSSDFENAATVQAQAILSTGTNSAGTYTVVSSSGPATALIRIFVSLVRQPNGHLVLAVTSAQPVDSSGNSLVGDSESQLQAYFGSYDQILMGTSRSQPLQVNEPTNYAPTFLNALDEEVGPGIDQALLAQGINWITLPLNAIVTVVFSDGTKALYQKTNSQITDHWAWAGVAWDKKGNRINRAGQPLSNPNTSGGGGGSVHAPGFGPGVSRNWWLSFSQVCTQNLTIIDENGVATDLGTIFVPCP